MPKMKALVMSQHVVFNFSASTMHYRAAMVLISLNVRGRDSTRNYKGGRKGEMIQYAGNIGSQLAE